MKKNFITAMKIDGLALLITLGICLAVALIVGFVAPASANAPTAPDPAPSIIEDSTTVTIIGTGESVDLTREDLAVPITIEPAPMPIDAGEPPVSEPAPEPAPDPGEPIDIGGAMLLDYCTFEDDAGPCFWDANLQGNGIGHSFVRIDNFTYYLPGS